MLKTDSCLSRACVSVIVLNSEYSATRASTSLMSREVRDRVAVGALVRNVYVTGLSNLFTATLLRLPQSLKGVMVSKCDKPLEPLSTCPTYSNSFYPLQLFLPFHMYPNLPIHKISFIHILLTTN